MTSQLIEDTVWIPGARPSGASEVFSVDGAPHVRGTLSAATEIALPAIRQGRTAEGVSVLTVGPGSSGSFTLSLRVPAADAVTPRGSCRARRRARLFHAFQRPACGADLSPAPCVIP